MWMQTRVLSPLKSPSSVTSLSPASSNGSRSTTPIQSMTSFDQSQQVVQPGERIRFSTETSTSRVVEVDELDETITLMDQFRGVVSEQHVNGIVQETKYMLTDPNVLSQEVVVTTSTIIRPSIDEGASASASEDEEGDIASDKAVGDSTEKRRDIGTEDRTPVKNTARLSPEESPPDVGEEARSAARQVIDEREKKEEKRPQNANTDEAPDASTALQQNATGDSREDLNGFRPFSNDDTLSVSVQLPRLRTTPSPSLPSRSSVTSPLMRQLQYVDERYSSKPAATSSPYRRSVDSTASSETPMKDPSSVPTLSGEKRDEAISEEETKASEPGGFGTLSFTPIRVPQPLESMFSGKEAVHPPSEASSARALSSAVTEENTVSRPSAPTKQQTTTDETESETLQPANMAAVNDLNAQIRSARRHGYVQIILGVLSSIPKLLNVKGVSIIRYVATMGAFLYMFLSWWRLILLHSSNQTLVGDLREFFFWVAFTTALAYFFVFAGRRRSEAGWSSADRIERLSDQQSRTTVVEVAVSKS